ncbi:2-isopropylmalate synthase [candidate division KSB1 bacterium]|nr:2-isopropylmalate synthase [candidate division KSB1 bacterium]RQW06626.1 MAG: 2-isopropylmalate synthase [candidate division KSB1 bacterium]
MDENRVIIFDTTLRDGEQSPGASMSVDDKVALALQLERLNVDVIEAGFPISSDVQFEGVKLVAAKVRKPTICGLARCIDQDIDRAAAALERAARPRIHTFIATSKIHMDKKFRKSEAEILEMAIKSVTRARGYVDDVEFSPEDSARTGKEFLFRIIEAAISAGATTINVPDTVGYSNPEEFGQLIREIFERVPNMRKAILSVHCHNDLGLAVANTLAAIRNGAQQAEVTINGIGERAGNCSLEEVVMALKTRESFYRKHTAIKTDEIVKTSRMVSKVTGMIVQPNKAIVGANAFAHEAGIHQDAMLKDRTTYEIMTPESVGWGDTKIVLGRHSGRHGLKSRLQDLGYNLGKEDLDKVYERFLKIADKKKEVFDADLEALVGDEIQDFSEAFMLEYFHILSGDKVLPTATIALKHKDTIIQDASVGDGPVDAAFKAIDKIINSPVKLIDYSLQALTGGKEAMGEVHVTIANNGRKFVGRGASTDVIEASIRAYLHAHNRLLHAGSKSESEH